MKAIHRLLLAMLPWALAAGARAQAWVPSTPERFKQDLEASRDLYEGWVNMRQATYISAFLTATDEVPHQRSTSVLWRTGDRYKVEYMGMETYQDKDLRVVVDREQRRILVGVPQDLSGTGRETLQQALLADIPLIERTERPDGVRYRLRLDGLSGLGDMEAAFDKAGWLHTLTLYWAEEVATQHRAPLAHRVRPKVVLEFGRPERIAPGSVNADPRTVVGRRGTQLAGLGEWGGYHVFDTRVP